MSAPSILISGASIAGPTLAYWLGAAGWKTTVVERSDGLREAGQNVDVRGASREVVRRMGIEDDLFAARTGEQGTEFVDERGRSIAAFPQSATRVDGATAELEILRGELSRVLYDSTRDDSEYLFGDQIAGLDDTGDRVEVTFKKGEPRTFDVVVIAEGLTSRTRRMVMPEARMSHLGIYMAYLTIPRTAEDNDYWRWYHATDQRILTLRPDNFGSIRAVLAFMTNVRGLEDLPTGEQTALLRSTYAEAGWAVPRVLEHLDDEPYYFDAIGQVRIPRWSRGRIGLVGDAAYCATPLSGMGTSLSIVGAYVLAAELATERDAQTAFARFEQRMRPYVDRAQNIPASLTRLTYPKGRLGINAIRTVGRLAASRPAQKLALFDRASETSAADVDLPDFHPAATSTDASRRSST